MAQRTRIKRNDTRPAFAATLRDGEGTVVNLSGATARFHMRHSRTRALKVDAAMNVVSPTLGTVRYDWVAADTDTLGVFLAEVQVTFGDGTVSTFPNDSDHEVEVVPEVA